MSISALSENVLYVSTVQPYRKQLPKMQRLWGRLREVVVYKNRTTGSLFWEEGQVHLLFIDAIFKLGYV